MTFVTSNIGPVGLPLKTSFTVHVVVKLQKKIKKIF